MSLSQIIAASAATSSSITGTDTPLILKDSVTNLFVLDEPDVTRELQRTVMFTASDGRPSETGANGYTQARSRLFVKSPKKLTNGVVTQNGVDIRVNIDPETTEEEANEQLLLAVSIATSELARNFMQRQITG